MPILAQSLNVLQSYDHGAQSLLLDYGGAKVAISMLTETIIRVRLAPDGRFAQRRSWAVVTPDHAFTPVDTTLSETEHGLVLRTAKLTLKIERDTGRISFYTSADQPFCGDAEGFSWSAQHSPITCRKRLHAQEYFYGFGERSGQLNQRGLTRTNWTTDQHRYGPGSDPLYIAIPSFLALRQGLAYGIFLNNTWHSRFDLGVEDPATWSMTVDGGELDYYLCFGPTPAEVLQSFGRLLGTTPLPPRWALGYHQSRWGYNSAEQIRQIAQTFRQRQLPCDVIHLDIDHMDGYRDFTWNPERFADPTAMVQDLAEQQLHLVNIVDPGVKIDPEYAVYQSGLEHNSFIRRANGEIFHGYVWPDDSVFPDFSRPEVRAWWATMQRRLIDIGISGIWNDMNEPTVFTMPFSQGGSTPQPIELEAIQGPADERTTHAEMHNLYGLGMAQAAYAGIREVTNQRPFVLTRSGYAGIQRWSACWMGDNASRWEHLELAISQLVNMGLSGVPFVGTDIGGFFDNASPELFARWMQFGILMPFCRGHSHTDTAPHEPWQFGVEVEAICREYLQLRYQLLPYLYTLFWQSSQDGAPILRPLFYEFPNDPATYQLHDQVMLGSALLAAPIYQPGKTQRHVYLPVGQWYDWWTNELIEGPTHVLAQAPLERLPLYVRAGTILPLGSASSQHTGQVAESLSLECYPGNGSFSLYEDDGLSFAYQQGQSAVINYQISVEQHTLTIRSSWREGDFRPAPRNIQLRIHGISVASAATLAVANYDSAQRVATLSLTTDEHLHLQIQLD